MSESIQPSFCREPLGEPALIGRSGVICKIHPLSPPRRFRGSPILARSGLCVVGAEAVLEKNAVGGPRAGQGQFAKKSER